MPIHNAREKLVHDLSCMYDAEFELSTGWFTMIESVTDRSLKSALLENGVLAEQRIETLEVLFASVKATPLREPNQAARGILRDIRLLVQATAVPEILDASLAAAAIRAQGYLLAGYADLLNTARAANLDAAIDLLALTVREQFANPERLEQMAVSLLKRAA